MVLRVDRAKLLPQLADLLGCSYALTADGLVGGGLLSQLLGMLLFAQKQFRQCLSPGEHAFVELRKLSLLRSEPLAHFVEGPLALLSIALGQFDLLAKHVDALFAL